MTNVIQAEEEKVNLHGTIDAEIWTQEWLKTIGKNPSIPTDKGTMIAWFANALMAGYDYAIYQIEAGIRDCPTTKEQLELPPVEEGAGVGSSEPGGE